MLLFVLTDLLGIDPAVAGGVILFSLVLDAALDPAIGVIAEKLRTPIGQYGPLILVGAPLAALSFIALLSLPLLGLNELWVVAPVLLLFRFSYTLIDVPHNSLLTRASFDSRQRSRIAGLRFLFSTLASLTLAVAIAPLVSRAAPLSPTGLAQFSVVAGAASVLVMFLSWLAVRRSDIEISRTTVRPASLATVIKSLRTNRNYLSVLALSGVAALTLPLFAKSQLFVTRYVMDAPDLASPALLCMIFGQFLGLPFWTWLAQRRENASALGGAHAWLVLAACGFILLGTQNTGFYLLLCAAIGVAASGVYSVIWAMIANCVEHGQSLTGSRVEATLYALATLVQKSAIGVGAAIFGIALSASGYTAGQDATPLVKATMIGLASGAPLIGSIVCLMLLRGFSLSHSDHETALNRIRANAGSP